ncbi:MAG: PP2C family serine/threonine-protein phosphatase [Legionella sp.]|uniref:PP2C family serine/threonine-protein phosphatase n=1 Tax=Legionella sp. TaxID=459 RepID=UPI0039E37538
MNKSDEFVSIPQDKATVHEANVEHHFGIFEMMGLRPSQEDAAVAHWFVKSAFMQLSPQEIGKCLWTSYKVMNQQCCQSYLAGATASTTVYDGKGNFITANLGDSVAFAVIYDQKGQIAFVARLNKTIHHPDYESERLAKIAAMVVGGRLISTYGSLALSRAMGDSEYRQFGVCDDAEININTIAELTLNTQGKLQIIITCDGFTEPLASESKDAHEQWLRESLQAIHNVANLSEADLAKLLAQKAFNAGSRDNISVVVQTLVTDEPFLVGIYDGHGGKQTSTYIAQHIISIFAKQCALSPKDYARQRFSAHRYFEIYCRDNKDEAFYQECFAKKIARSDELAQSGGINEHLKALFAKKDDFIDKVVIAEEDIAAPMRSLLCITELCAFIESLCTRYMSLELDKHEFLACLCYVLKNSSNSFNDEKYRFLPYDFVKHRENALFLQNNCGLADCLDALYLAAEEYSCATPGLISYSLFTPTQTMSPDEDAPDANFKPK